MRRPLLRGFVSFCATAHPVAADRPRRVSRVQRLSQEHAGSLGEVLHHLCCAVLDATAKLPPASSPSASTSHTASASAPIARVPTASSELLAVDRALASSELRQTCNAIELLRSAAREGAPVHEWSLRDFSTLGPGKVRAMQAP